MNVIYWGTIAYFTGCYFGLKTFPCADSRIYIFGALGAVLIMMFCCRKLLKLFYATVVAFFFLLGLWFGVGSGYAKLELTPFFHQEVKVCGYIDPLSVRHNERSNSCSIECVKFMVNQQSVDFRGKLRVNTQDTIPERGILQVSGQLLSLNSYRNPGVFDMEMWNRVHGFGGRIYKAKVAGVSSNSDSNWQFWRNINDSLALFNLRLRQEIANVVHGEAGAVLSGMLLGGSVGLSDETREIFSNNGLSHLLSVSGTHLMLLAGFLLAVLQPLYKYQKKWHDKQSGKRYDNNPKAWETEHFSWVNVTVVVILFLYAVLCGLRPPVLRALLMTMVVLFGGRGAARGNVLCLTAIFLLILNPLWLLDVGFQLSFGAVAGLIWLLPKIQKFLTAYLPDVVADLLAVTLSAQLATLPFLIGYFHQISLISLPVSLLLLPLLELGTLLALSGVLLSFLMNFSLPLEIGGVIVTQVLRWAELLASIEWSIVVVATQPLWYATVYYLLIFFVLPLDCVAKVKPVWRWTVAGLCSLLLVGKFLFNYFVEPKMAVYFLDVGQGDCAVAITPQRETVIIDTGGSTSFDVGSRVLTPFLRGKGITKIDLLVLSHGDYDHAGGAGGLARNIPINKIIFQQGGLSEWEKNLLAVSPDSELCYAQSGKYRFGEMVLQIIDAPNGTEDNNSSTVVCGVEYNGYGILFTGDIDVQRENELNLSRTYNIVKVPHHGSKYSNSEDFYNLVKPEVAVISVGKDNGYGHPHGEALARIKASGAQIYRTDKNGMISIIFDENGYECKTYE